MANRVELADESGAAITDANPLPVSGTVALSSGATPATGTKSSVNSGIASVTILLANTSRKGASITNTDANALYIDASGGTASATSYSYKVLTDGVVEIPFGYTGLITGIWAADGAGGAVVVEYT
jgi:hypothetical protein